MYVCMSMRNDYNGFICSAEKKKQQITLRSQVILHAENFNLFFPMRRRYTLIRISSVLCLSIRILIKKQTNVYN